MPITGVLDLQRRSLPLGDIRIGESEEITRNGKTFRKPVRRKTFLFTTQVEETAHAIAAKCGGTVKPWDRRDGWWAVDTDLAVLEVWVPPRGLAVDANMELWEGGRRRRKCDGITEERSGQPCMCPQPQDRTDPADVARAANERKRLAGLNPPQACKPLTRINVQIPGLPGVTGVWVLRTGSANAAVETADTGEVLERARNMDVYLPALLLIHWRQGQDGKPYPVLSLRLRPSAEQVMQLEPGMDGMLAQLHGGARLALTTGTPDVKTAPAEAAPGARAPEDALAGVAAQIAAGIPLAQSREDVAKLIEAAKAHPGALDKTVWSTPESEDDAEVEETLRDLLDARWRQLPAPVSARSRQRQDGPEEAHAARPPTPPATSPADGADGSLFDDNDPQWGGQ